MNNGLNTIPNPAKVAFDAQLLHVQHTAASGTDGGTATAGSWETRPLTTVLTNEIDASLSSNALTLPAGTYFVQAQATFAGTNLTQCRIQNTSTGVTLLNGVNVDTASGQGNTGEVCGRFTLPNHQVVELQSRVSTTNAGDGFGQANSFGTEVYADVLIWKLN